MRRGHDSWVVYFMTGWVEMYLDVIKDVDEDGLWHNHDDMVFLYRE